MSLTKTLAVAALVALAPAVAPAQNYPTGPIELLIPFATGGANDLVAREIAAGIEKIVGQPVVPTQKTGANGYIALQQLVTGQPDGAVVSHQSLGTIMLGSLIKKQAVDPATDIRYVGQMALITSAVAVPKDSEYQTLADLVAAIQAAPGDMKWGHTGAGGFHHVNGVSLLQSIGGDAIDVPFKGSSETVAAMMGGHIDYGFLSTSNYLGFEDELRFLAFASESRDQLLPDVPTAKEAGVEMITIGSPLVLTVHKDTPDAIVETLDAAMKTTVETEAYQAALKRLGIDPVYRSGAELQTYIADNVDAWRSVVSAIKTE